MTYRGTFKNGVTVFDQTPPLKEGQKVRVKPTPCAGRGPKRGTGAALLKHAGQWAGDPAELDRLLDDLKKSKWADVAAERELLGLPPDPNASGAGK